MENITHAHIHSSETHTHSDFIGLQYNNGVLCCAELPYVRRVILFNI